MMTHRLSGLFLAPALSVALLGCTSDDRDGEPAPSPATVTPSGPAATGQSSAAQRGGVLIGATVLPERVRIDLALEIDAARQQTPEIFAQLQALRAEVPELDERKRGRLAPIMPALVSLGADALLPMVAEIAFDADPRGDLTDTAWVAWRTGLLEATGKLRSEKAAPVLWAVLQNAPDDTVVARAAAQAYAKLNTPAVAAALIEHIDSPHPQRLAFVEGMGHCRQTLVSDKLGALLDAKPNATEARALAEGLGVAGSKWAWETELVANAGDQEAVRSRAAEALVAAFAEYDDGETRTALRRAILLVDHPDTASMIEAHRAGAAPDADHALAALAERVANNPLNRYSDGVRP